MEFNSNLMASSHNSESGSTVASAYVKGSSLSNNNTLLALRNLSDLRGAGATSTTGSLTGSAMKASLAESSPSGLSRNSSSCTVLPLAFLVRNSYQGKYRVERQTLCPLVGCRSNTLNFPLDIPRICTYPIWVRDCPTEGA